MHEFLDAAPVWLPGVIAMAVLMAFSGFFSASETAVFYLSRDELRAFQMGRPGERLVARLLQDPDRLLSAILFWNLVINLSFFAVSVVVARRLAGADQAAAAGLFGLASVIAIIVFGEVLPKSFAVSFRRRFSALVATPLALAVRLLDPVTPVLQRVTRLARQAFWPQLRLEQYLHAEDLERAVEASELSEDVIRHERHVLHNILDLTEIAVEEVMRPRGTYLTLRPPISIASLNGQVPPSDYVLVAEDDQENIRGAVALTTFATIPEEHLEDLAEDVVYVPWCATLAFALQQLRERFASVLAVVNELGETIGVITYEDLLDTVLLPEASRARRVLRREPVLEIAPGRYHVEGMTTLRYLARYLEVEDYDPDEESQVTVAGLLHEELERIPVAGDECTWEGHTVRVIDGSQRGQLRAVVFRPDGAPAGPEAAETAE